MCQQIHRDFIFTSFHRIGLTLLGCLGQKTEAICLLGLCGVPPKKCLNFQNKNPRM